MAACWTFASGWRPENVDVAGRLIETCLPAADYLAWRELRGRARSMLDTLLAQPAPPSVGRVQGLIIGHIQPDDPESLGRALKSGHARPEVPAHTTDQRVHVAYVRARQDSPSGGSVPGGRVPL